MKSTIKRESEALRMERIIKKKKKSRINKNINRRTKDRNKI